MTHSKRISNSRPRRTPRSLTNSKRVKELATRPFKRAERALIGRKHPQTTAAASKRMGRIRQYGTSAEIKVRKAATAIGMHYRTRNRDLPGNPDLANRSKKWAVFVHGCFWHHHHGCTSATTPKTNRSFWLEKFAQNKARDASGIAALMALSFDVAVVWECEAGDREVIQARLYSLSAGMPLRRT